MTSIDLVRSRERQKRPSCEESLALQTYTFFHQGNSHALRVERFQQGQTPELELENPGLDEVKIRQHIANLENMQDDEPGSFSRDYRLAEAYYLLAAHDLSIGRTDQTLIDQFQKMNVELYGEIDTHTFDTVLNTLWTKLKGAKTPSTQKLFDELANGFSVEIAGEQYDIPPIPQPSHDEALPLLDKDVEEKIQAIIEQDLLPVKMIIEKHIADATAPVSVEQAVEIFKEAIEEMHLDIDVVVDKDAMNLSWSSAKQAVVIGEKRKPIKNADSLFGLFVHEVYIHGQRYVNGKTRNASLANGLFTDFDSSDGEEASYLTFEEGLASIAQKAAEGKSEKWDIASLGNYINIGLASQGYTSRQIYEIMCRVRTVLSEKKSPHEVPLPTEKAQNNTVTQLVRIFRGTPSHIPLKTTQGEVLHFGKDKAYLAGKLKVINFLNQIGEENIGTVWGELLKGKYDPTNKFQREFLLESEQVS